MEDVPLWAQTFNVISKNAVANANNQNSQEISTVVHTKDNRTESIPKEQPRETTTRQQRGIGTICDVTDQKMYRRSHQPPSSMGRLHSTLNISPVHLGVEKGIEMMDTRGKTITTRHIHSTNILSALVEEDIVP